MKTHISCLSRKVLLLIPIMLWMSAPAAHAQGPEGKSFGFGIVLGTLDGASVKIWTASDQAFIVDFGGSWFGPLRLEGDYDWHFNPFHSTIVKMYAGPGLALAFGNGDEQYFGEDHTSSVGVGVRVMFGVNIIPHSAPLEIYLGVGPLIGLVPAIGAGVDAEVGIRFYP